MSFQLGNVHFKYTPKKAPSALFSFNVNGAKQRSIATSFDDRMYSTMASFEKLQRMAKQSGTQVSSPTSNPAQWAVVAIAPVSTIAIATAAYDCAKDASVQLLLPIHCWWCCNSRHFGASTDCLVVNY